MAKWPADNQTALLNFYGTPGPDVERQLVDVIPPFQMYYDGKPVRRIRFHKKAAPALRAALQEIWDYYGHDQGKIDTLGISKYSGGYNPRYVRGSTTKWSNHAYGAAIDINAEQNGFGTGHGNMPQPVIDAFKRQGFRWGGDYRGRTDPMHFEACDATGYPGPSTVMPAKFVDAPQTDADGDVVVPVVDPEPVQDAPAAPVKAGRVAGWLSSLGGLGFLAYLTDWRVVAVLFGSLFIIGCALVLFIGPGDVRAWLKRQVS